MSKSKTVYVSGEFLDEDNAHIRFDDRGFIFADGLYEVIRYYSGEPFRLDGHMQRLRDGAAEVGLELPEVLDDPVGIIDELVRRNGVGGTDFSVYLQVTRGAEGRAHAFPARARPTVIAWILPVAPASPEVKPQTAITVPDRRWSMCHLKTTGLMLNVLAKQAAAEAGADEALFIRDDSVTEGAVTNFFGVRDGRVNTHPAGRHILSGITRGAALEVLAEQDVDVDLSPLAAAELENLDEAFLTGTGCEIAPIVAIDGRAVGEGAVGPVTRLVVDGYREMTGRLRAAAQAV
jgi:D-alanine transaminase